MSSSMPNWRPSGSPSRLVRGDSWLVGSTSDRTEHVRHQRRRHPLAGLGGKRKGRCESRHSAVVVEVVVTVHAFGVIVDVSTRHAQSHLGQAISELP